MAPGVVPFQNELDEIFGNRPIIARLHIDSGLQHVPLPIHIELDETPTVSLVSTPPVPMVSTPPAPLVSTPPAPLVSTQTTSNLLKNKKKNKKFELVDLKMQYRQQKLEIFEKNKELLLFLNAERNARHKELMEALK